MTREIPAVYMRGGTSRALLFQSKDLPEASPSDDYAAWKDVFLTSIGSPDPNQRQLNGIGGGISSLSKVAVIGPPSREDADVDYTFGQVGVSTPTVSYRGNCGNISSAIGPFSVDQGLVEVSGEFASVRIHNTNTRKIIRAHFPVLDGRSVYAGDWELPGVAGTGAPIRLDFLEPAGAATGTLLPTGSSRETLTLADGGDLEVSLIDAANPTCFVHAGSLGLTGRESPLQIGENAVLMKKLIDLRVAASLKMCITEREEDARHRVNNLPLVCIVARPDPSREGEDNADLIIRMLSMDQPHKATPLTGALCAAAAAGLENSIVAENLSRGFDPALLRLRHPSGNLPVAVDAEGGKIRSVAVYRTAKPIMKGVVYC